MGNKSEVARLLNQIRVEYDAALQGLSGVAEVARHSFINASMENMGKLNAQLQEIIGTEEAMILTIDLMSHSEACSEQPNP
jgi:hypothetical protein